MTATPRVAERGRQLSRECRAIQRRLILFGDERLLKADTAALDAHLRACQECGRVERLLRGLLTAIHDMPVPEPEEAFWDQMAEAIIARIDARRALRLGRGRRSWQV